MATNTPAAGAVRPKRFPSGGSKRRATSGSRRRPTRRNARRRPLLGSWVAMSFVRASRSGPLNHRIGLHLHDSLPNRKPQRHLLLLARPPFSFRFRQHAACQSLFALRGGECGANGMRGPADCSAACHECPISMPGAMPPAKCRCTSMPNPTDDRNGRWRLMGSGQPAPDEHGI